MSVDQSPPPPPKKKRSGTNKRRLDVLNTFRSSREERAEMRQNAALAGLKFGSYMRELACRKPTTRAVPDISPDRASVNEFLGRVGRYEGNLYQVVRRMNFGDLPEVRTLAALADEARAFLAEARRLWNGGRAL
jgi:hypothetical protein